MNPALKRAHIRPVHPFPARMAPSIVWDKFPNGENKLKILDPMSGSGTTLVCAKLKGHHVVGCDTDPLARLIAHVWCTDVNREKMEKRARIVLKRAKNAMKSIRSKNSYLKNMDDETRGFVDYWFDKTNKRQLTALSQCILRVRDENERRLLMCAFSRMIITKLSGVSLGMDVSHSRPHKKYEEAPVKAFDIFPKSVSKILDNCPFQSTMGDTLFEIKEGDARNLPISDSDIDMIITSPPYLNAIDYLRGHRLSLVWMGWNVKDIRIIRSGNIGTERSLSSERVEEIEKLNLLEREVKALSRRYGRIVQRYLYDMNAVMRECVRVLKQDGRAIFVVGNSTIRGVFIKNSDMLIRLADINGFSLASKNTRLIDPKHRYLPPPNTKRAGDKLQLRMREEVILEFRHR